MKKLIIIIGLAAAAIASYGWSDRKLSRPADGIEIDQASPKADVRDISEIRKDILEAKIRESAYGKRIRAASQAAVPEVKAKDDGYDYKPETMPEFVMKSLDWLAQAQHDDGGWGGGASSRQGIRDPHAVKGDPATTSFAATAFLRSGHTPGKGKYKDVVRRATEYLVKVVEAAPEEGPRITPLTGTQPQAKMGAYVDTSLTARYLARVLNEMPKKDKLRKRVDKAIDKCIAKIQNSQQKDGSWKGGGWAPVLQSSLAGQALEIAQQAGKQVDQDVLNRARQNQKDNYDADSGKVRSDTAAGVALYAFAGAQRASASETLEARDLVEKAKKEGKLAQNAKPTATTLRKIGVGDKRAEELAQSVVQNEKQQTRVQNDDALLSGFGNNGGEEYLSYLMTSESFVITGGEAWSKWDEKMHRRLRKIQNPNGSWTGHHCITS
ncbi:MAG: prenyltransferase/squalene oxidase repeat-containing protein, partial [Opitutales bacterium]